MNVRRVDHAPSGQEECLKKDDDCMLRLPVGGNCKVLAGQGHYWRLAALTCRRHQVVLNRWYSNMKIEFEVLSTPVNPKLLWSPFEPYYVSNEFRLPEILGRNLNTRLIICPRINSETECKIAGIARHKNPHEGIITEVWRRFFPKIVASKIEFLVPLRVRLAMRK